MPIVGWFCPVCKREVALNHFENTVCGTGVHPDYANMVLHSNDEHYTTGRNLVEVTGGIGCPRSRALERSDEPLYVNPLEYNAMMIGKAWDKQLENAAPKELCKVEVSGELVGVMVHGEIDRVRTVYDSETRSYLCVEDHKHGNNFAKKFVEKEGVKLEHKLQLSIYAYLYGKQFGETPTHGIVWNHYSGAASSDPKSVVLPFVFLIMDITECLNAKPYNGEFTVAELYRQAAQVAEGSVSWTDLPLVGKTMSFGSKSYCDYCQFRAKCFMQDTGAPF